MAYFMKLVGLSDEPLPKMWWSERPEIVTGVFFSWKPKSIHTGDKLIYYAVGTGGRFVAEAEVTGEASQNFPSPPQWPPERRERFCWRMPVKLLAKCAADSKAPITREFYSKDITGGSFRRLTDEQGRQMGEAIRKAGSGS